MSFFCIHMPIPNVDLSGNLVRNARDDTAAAALSAKGATRPAEMGKPARETT